jgi:hypothetical protein
MPKKRERPLGMIVRRDSQVRTDDNARRVAMAAA